MVLSQVEAGHLVSSRPPFSTTQYDCAFPQWSARPAQNASTTFVFKDASSTITAEFQTVAPTLTLVAPASTTVQSGDFVELEWSPATDVLSPDVVVTFSTAASGTTGDVLATGSAVTISGSRLRFQIPPANAWTLVGPGTLSVFASGQHGVVRCEGVATCEARFSSEPSLALTRR